MYLGLQNYLVDGILAYLEGLRPGRKPLRIKIVKSSFAGSLISSIIKCDMKVNLKALLITLILPVMAVAAEDSEILSAEKLIKQGQIPASKNIITQYLSSHDSPAAYEKVGTLYARNKKWEDAVHYLEIASNRAQGISSIWYKLGIAYHQSHKTDDAVAAFRKALALNPKSLVTIISLGEVLEFAEDRYDARQIYIEAGKKLGNNPEVVAKLCLLNYEDAYWKEAVKYCQIAVNINPKDEVSWAFLANSNYELQLRPKTFQVFKSAVAANPKSSLLHRARGLLFYREKSFEQAVVDLGYAAAQDPHDDEAMLFFARSLYELGRFNDARIAYNEACLMDRSYRSEFLAKERSLEKMHKDELANQYQENIDKL